MADGGSLSYHLGDGELPCGEGYEAGNNKHGRYHMSHRISEHGCVSKAERRAGRYQLCMRDKPPDNRRGGHVAYTGNHRSCQNSDRHILFRVFHRVGIGAGCFETEECPENDGDGIAHGEIERHIMRVPGSHIDVRVEKIPAAEKKANDRKKNADHAQRGEFAEFFRSDKADGGGDDKRADGCQTNFHGRKVKTENVRTVADYAGGDSHVGDNQGNGVSVVGKEVSKTAEPVFRVTAHAAYLFAVHAAFGKSVGKNSSADRGKNPGENGNRTDFRECCRQKNNAGSHHVDGGDCGELYHSHFSAFRQCSSLLSRTNFRHIFGTGEDICPESHRNARFSGIGNPHLLSLW